MKFFENISFSHKDMDVCCVHLAQNMDRVSLKGKYAKGGFAFFCFGAYNIFSIVRRKKDGCYLGEWKDYYGSGY